MKKYFEYIDADSSKFWEIEVSENTHTVRFGKIGTNGQSQTKPFDSADEAQDDAEKLISSKIKKGYVEKTAMKTERSEEAKSDIHSAKDWAKDYMQRFEKMVTELQNHDLVQNVRFNKGKPLTDEQLNEVQDELGYKLNDYIVEFYKQNNGLQLHWNSFAARPDVDAEKHRQEINDIKDFRRGDDDAAAVEGWVCIYPFDTFIKNYGSELFYKNEEVNHLNYYEDAFDAKVKVLDDYHYYHQTGIPVNGDPNPCLYHFSDHGACCADNEKSNFVIYMEFLLLTYGFVGARTGGLHGINKDALKADAAELPEFLLKCIREYPIFNYEVDQDIKDHMVNAIIKDHYQHQGSEYLNSLGGLWGSTKDLDHGLQKIIFDALGLSSDDIEELKEVYAGFLEENNG
jgi:predicted DNA-binding WGR domain protein